MTADLFDDVGDLPPRSQLYRLQIEGRGTCRQESLLSYFHRLARAHSLAPMDLMVHCVVPNCTIKAAQSAFSFSKLRIRTANGYAKYAQELVQTLTMLTCSEHLSEGTLLHWLPLLDPHGGGLLHPRCRWCPSCLAEAADAGCAACYDLLWNVCVVDHCAIHLTPLASECPTCGAQQPFLSESSSYGRCHTCHGLLGRRGGLWDENTLTPQARFNLDAIAAMISLGSRAQNLARPRSLGAAILGLAEAYFDGAIGRLEEAIGIPKTFSAWVTGAARPRLSSLMEVCFRIGVAPIELLSPDFEPRMHGGRFREGPRRSARPSVEMTTQRRIELSRFVDDLVRANHHVTIKDTVRGVGMTVGSFKYHLPVAFRKLSEHAKTMRIARTKARLEAHCAKAVAIARTLFEESSHVPRRRLDRALGQVGLSIRSPSVRKAAFAELRRLREVAVAGGELRKAEQQ